MSLRAVHVLSAGAALASGSCISPRVSVEEPRSPSANDFIPFDMNGPFNRPIPANAIVDAASETMVSYLSRTGRANAALYEFGIPIWDASAASPRVRVNCAMSPAWGVCPFHDLVPMPADARPHTGSDGALVIVDRSAHRSFEFWQLRRTGAAWLTSWGTIQDLRGTGFQEGASSTASGASRLGGVVRVAEIANGRILHALVMSSDSSCKHVFRAPAVKTDGESQRPDCTPQGARLQLDPAIDVGTLPGITPGERLLAKALQDYGVYLIDKGGAPMSISFELARDATSAQTPGAVYQSAGLPWDYYDLPHIPWRRLRVLSRWDGQ